MLNNIKIVLCNTSHNGNIGSAARAMKTMGITNLILVNPTAALDDHAIALACNASDVVRNAKIVTSLDEALSDTVLAIGLSARKREYTPHLSTPKEILPEIFTSIAGGNKVAIVFGSEKFGLSIEEVEKCNRLVTIPGNPEYFSLNLAQAVQIMCYEIYSQYNGSVAHLEQGIEPANFADNQGILNHLETILNLANYKNKDNKQTRRKLQNILHKAQLERDEVDLLRGILKAIEIKLN
ncbi:MAG: tRNA ((32)/uridine(32)-2-O)-methyltransferase TrmJ [Burkholderiales bacterium]|jgi:tRNA/rRNA methyltransferase|nr:tRNA ((32)/uridine(32)-2-O)-methyltransferase TrmJ [Burkholderiales bacterium]